MRFLRAHSSVLAVCLVGLIAITSILGVRAEASHREAGDERADRQTCASLEITRNTVKDLIDVVLAGQAPSEPVDLEAIPEFQAVDPEVQALVRVLVRPENGGGDAVRERLRGFRDGLLATPLPDFCT